MTKHIPNLITLGNLFCGLLAAIFAVNSNFKAAALFVALGICLDFFDGFAARLLKVSGELGKQLDSLADMVTSGVVPGIVMFKLLEPTASVETQTIPSFFVEAFSFYPIQLIGLLLPLGACYRLAKFNIDIRQTETFIGLPTPAMSLFVIVLPLIIETTTFNIVDAALLNTYVLIVITVLLTVLMNAELPLFSLKFKSFAFKTNVIKYLFLAIAIVLIVLLKYLSIPLIILLYVLLSIFGNRLKIKI